jgi:hypothetical protein
MSLTPAPFQAFTIKANGVSDRLITDITVTQAYDPDMPTPVRVAKHAAKALWDTGATRSSVSPSVVSALGLVPVGAVEVHHGGGCETCATHLVNFRLPNGVGIVGLMVTELPLHGFDVLVGMDVITLGDMSITHAGGKSRMSFRTPSIGGSDFVAEHNAIMKKTVTRNDPCWCGAQGPDGTPVKFKNCHGR